MQRGLKAKREPLSSGLRLVSSRVYNILYIFICPSLRLRELIATGLDTVYYSTEQRDRTALDRAGLECGARAKGHKLRFSLDHVFMSLDKEATKSGTSDNCMHATRTQQRERDDI